VALSFLPFGAPRHVLPISTPGEDRPGGPATEERSSSSLSSSPATPTSRTVSGMSKQIGHASSLAFERSSPPLSQPDDSTVMAEVIAPELKMTIEAELAQNAPAEAAHEKVGQHAGARSSVNSFSIFSDPRTRHNTEVHAGVRDEGARTHRRARP